MSNKQTFPNALSPLNGDVASSVGSSTATVTGIQNSKVLNQLPQNGQILIFDNTLPGGGAYVPGDPIVSGTDTPGTNPSRNPVQVAGIDDGNLVRELRTDPYGAIELSAYDRNLLEQILLQLRANTAAILSLDGTALDSDYKADNFQDQNVGA